MRVHNKKKVKNFQNFKKNLLFKIKFCNFIKTINQKLLIINNTLDSNDAMIKILLQKMLIIIIGFAFIYIFLHIITIDKLKDIK